MKQTFETEYAAATDGAGKVALAAKLMERAEQPSDTPAVRYILLSEAARLAADASDFEAMTAALDKLAERYAVDVMELKASAFFEAAKTAQGEEANKALALAALAACDEAVLLDKIESAKKIAGTANGAAQERRQQFTEAMRGAAEGSKRPEEVGGTQDLVLKYSFATFAATVPKA